MNGAPGPFRLRMTSQGDAEKNADAEKNFEEE
jgi:hypothetical protein